MEDYAGASASRLQDVEGLLSPSIQRTVAAAHLGGVAVECQIKCLIVRYHQLAQWDGVSKRSKDPKRGQPIPRPGHGLIAGLRLMDDVYRKARADYNFLTHLDRVMHPSGASVQDFIELRYSAKEFNSQTMIEWRRSLNYVIGWLRKNESTLL